MSLKLNKNELLRIDSLSKQYNDNIVLENINFSISENEKITIVGQNGSGKSTLLKILAKNMEPSTGQVLTSDFTTIGYLEQDFFIKEDKQILDFLTEKHEILNNFAKKILNGEDEKTNFNEAGGYKVFSIMAGLGFKNFNEKKYLSEFSGGQQTIISLAKILLEEPNLMILDEPTNHLDEKSLEWLEKYLKKTKSSIILVTHDRTLLKNITRYIFEIEDKKLLAFRGNFENFIDSRERQLLDSEKKYKNLQKEKILLDKELEIFSRKLKNFEAGKEVKKKDNDKIAHNFGGESFSKDLTRNIKRKNTRLAEINKFTNNFSGKIKKFTWSFVNKQDEKENSKEFRSLEIIQGSELQGTEQTFKRVSEDKSLDLRTEVEDKTGFACVMINKRIADNSLELRLSRVIERTEEKILSFENIGFKTLLENISGEIKKGDKIVLKGLNGCGKTTFLKIILGEIVADSGMIKINENTKIGYLSQFNDLNKDSTVLDIFQIPKDQSLEILWKFCLFDEEIANRKIENLSAGQIRRLKLGSILMNNPDFLVLDEPTNHLDYKTCEYLEKQLNSFTGTLLAVSHDRRFIEKINPKIWEIKNGKLIRDL